MIPEMNLTGWKPDMPDHRDVVYKTLRPQNRLLKALQRPRAKYLKDVNLPRVYHQGHIGSCVGHGSEEACAYAIDFENARADGTKPADYSRLFAYYNARQNKLLDEGATIRDGVKGIVEFGICTEALWPYVEANFATVPSPAAYAEAAHRRNGIAYFRLETINDILDCIVQGYPVIFGTSVFDSFMEVGRDGIVPMPSATDAPAGGHCMLVVGYSMTRQGFYVRNSWGETWGDHGNCWVSFEYVRTHASDFWTIRNIAA